MPKYLNAAFLRFSPENNKATSQVRNFGGQKYPYLIPQIYIQGGIRELGGDSLNFTFFNYVEDSIVSVEDKRRVVEYSCIKYEEILVVNAFGQEVWVDGRTATSVQLTTAKGRRPARAYEVNEIDFVTKEIKKYIVSEMTVEKLENHEATILYKDINYKIKDKFYKERKTPKSCASASEQALWELKLKVEAREKANKRNK